MTRYTLGIDNGVTGSLAIIGPSHAAMTSTPTRDATMGRAGKIIRRVDTVELIQWIKNAMPVDNMATVQAYIERPFTGSAMMINTTVLAARAFEATVIALEQLGIGYEVVDSRDWQKPMLPGVTGRENLKRASKAKGIQLYPALKPYIEQVGDADSLLIARWAHN
jgi:hypothetical protein